MDKLAMLKLAEVRGVVAALCDAEMVPQVKTAEDFDALSEIVAENLDGAEYEMTDVIDKTAEVLEALENGEFEGEEKEASEEEVDERAVYAALGELTMMKQAGEISDEDFEKEAASLQGLVGGVKNMASNAYKGDIGAVGRAAKGKAQNAAKWVGEGVTGKNLRAARKTNKEVAGRTKDLDAFKKKYPQSQGMREGLTNKAKSQQDAIDQGADLAKRLRNTGLKQTGAAAGIAGAGGLGGKALYDKYKDQ